MTQPGARPGQSTYCPVSGVVFEVKPASARRQVGERALYFCCEACAEHFSQNQALVLAARGIAP